MSWTYTSGSYQANYGDAQLRVWLEPSMPIPSEAGDYGSDEHPFVWHFEVKNEYGEVDFRGVRETMEEAQHIAAQKAEQFLPDLLRVA